MARQPEVFVRSLEPEELQRLVPGQAPCPATGDLQPHTGGVRHMFAALDLATGQMFYRFRDRQRWREFLGFLKQLRDRYPAGKLYVVCDNYGPPKEN